MYSSLGRLLAVDIAYPCLPYYFPLKSLEGHRKASKQHNCMDLEKSNKLLIVAKYMTTKKLDGFY